MSCSRDRISGLPDEVLGKVLSLVPTKVAASTSVLSKRWMNLLVLVDALNSEESMGVYPNEEEAESGGSSDRFIDFLDKTLALLSNSPIKKFSLSHRGRFSSFPGVYGWIWTAMEERLGGLDYNNYRRLINGCPVLEELFVTDIGADADDPYPPCCTTSVKSASIKRLVVSVDMPYGSDKESFEQFHHQSYVKAPSLVYLDYSSHVFMDYRFVDLDSLAQVRLNLKLWDRKPNKPIFADVTKLAAFHFCCKYMPVFNNLLNLSIESNKKKGWQVMPLLLKSCPHLHTLLLKGLVHRVTDKCGDACACPPNNKHKNKSKWSYLQPLRDGSIAGLPQVLPA
ncbi:hypothetical protein DY000_02021013, partial [Brassica cretica]